MFIKGSSFCSHSSNLPVVVAGGDGHAGVQRTEVEPGREGDGESRGVGFHSCSKWCRFQTEMGPETTLVPVKRRSRRIWKISTKKSFLTAKVFWCCFLSNAVWRPAAKWWLLQTYIVVNLWWYKYIEHGNNKNCLTLKLQFSNFTHLKPDPVANQNRKCQLLRYWPKWSLLYTECVVDLD